MAQEQRQAPSTPPAGWSPQSLYGLKRFNGSDGGRLELLSVIVAWMKQEREWPSKLAVDERGKALAAGTDLYLLNPRAMRKISSVAANLAGSIALRDIALTAYVFGLNYY